MVLVGINPNGKIPKDKIPNDMLGFCPAHHHHDDEDEEEEEEEEPEPGVVKQSILLGTSEWGPRGKPLTHHRSIGR